MIEERIRSDMIVWAEKKSKCPQHKPVDGYPCGIHFGHLVPVDSNISTEQMLGIIADYHQCPKSMISINDLQLALHRLLQILFGDLTQVSSTSLIKTSMFEALLRCKEPKSLAEPVEELWWVG